MKATLRKTDAAPAAGRKAGRLEAETAQILERLRPRLMLEGEPLRRVAEETARRRRAA